MDLQTCATTGSLVELASDLNPQLHLLSRCARFQQSLGHLAELGKLNLKEARRHLEMAVQELAEALDLIEGGWKHHKHQPRKPNVSELEMELVDVMHFMYNAFLHLGGLPTEVSVIEALSCETRWDLTNYGVCPSYSTEPTLAALAQKANSEWQNVASMFTLNGHGQEWEQTVSGKLMRVRAFTSMVLENVRANELTTIMGGRFFWTPTQHQAYLAQGVWPYVYDTALSIPGCTAERLIGLFIAKNEINFERQRRGY